MSQKKIKVAFLHPDLGIGGAERLVVDAAVGLKQLGCEVKMYNYIVYFTHLIGLHPIIIQIMHF